MYGGNKKTNPAVIRKTNTPSRGDCDFKCPKTGSFLPYWSKNNDNSMIGETGARGMVEAKVRGRTSNKGHQSSCEDFGFYLK